MRTDRFVKNGLTTVPVVSILPSQLNELLKVNEAESNGCEVLLTRLPDIYKNASKHGLQTFLAPTADLNFIPQRKSNDAVYARCIQIYKSAFSQSTLKLLESGKLVIAVVANKVVK